MSKSFLFSFILIKNKKIIDIYLIILILIINKKSINYYSNK